jgi:inner membrane transporter RhtA
MLTAPLGTRSSHPALPLFAVAFSLICQNLGAVFAKSLFPRVGVEGVTALRVGLAACLLMVIHRPWRVRLDRADLGRIAAYGAILGLMNLLIYQAFARIPVGIAIAIEAIGPLAIVLLSARRPRDFLWFGLAAVGLALLLPLKRASASLDPLGLAFAAGAALAWALYIVSGKRVSSLPSGCAVSWGMTVASLLTVPFGAAHASGALMSFSVLLAGLAVATLSSALPYTLEMIALRGLPRHAFGILVSAAPALGALAGLLVLDERLASAQWIAIACIVIASAGTAVNVQYPISGERA